MTHVEVTCSACGDLFELKAAVHKLRKLHNKSGHMFCSRKCSGMSSKLFHGPRGAATQAGLAAKKWGISYLAARRILQVTVDAELQELLAGQSRYHTQRLKDMREAVQR